MSICTLQDGQMQGSARKNQTGFSIGSPQSPHHQSSNESLGGKPALNFAFHFAAMRACEGVRDNGSIALVASSGCLKLRRKAIDSNGFFSATESDGLEMLIATLL